MCRSRSAFTLIEVMLAAFVTGILLIVLFLIYTMGARALAKAQAQVDLLERMQVVLARFTRDGQASTMASVTVDPVAGAVSLPCARGASGNEVLDPSQDLLQWQRYCIYYYDAGKQAVLYREVVLNPPTTTVVDISLYDDGTGPHPLSYYLTGGSTLATNITGFQPTARLGALTLALQGQQFRAGSQQPETVSLQASVCPRN